MLIELKWLDNNKSTNHSTEIYRATHVFDSIDDATLITTVGPGVTTYLDTDVIHKETYYYRFRTVRGFKKSPASELFTFSAIPYTGPGPSSTVFGDESFGYFGKFPMSSSSIPSFNYLRELLGLTIVNETTLSNADLHKFAIGGTIRGTYAFPLAIGNEIPRDNPLIQNLLNGGTVPFTLGLHDWAIILPSAEHADNPAHEVHHYPGELRSMLGVITEMYARVEDAATGNRTGGRLLVNDGLNKFYAPLEQRYPGRTIKYIVSSDWVGDECTVINWTPELAAYPLRPKELHTEKVLVNTTAVWDDFLIWPVLVYTGLTRAKDV